MNHWKLTALALAVSLAACAPKQAPPPVVDMASMTCAGAFALSDVAPLQFDPKGKDEKTTTAILDSKSQCIHDAQGVPSLYHVFALPDLGAPYILAVRTIPWGGTLLAPKLLLLDGDAKTLRSTSHSDFTFRGQELSALMRSHPGESYLVVTSDNEVLGRDISRIVEAVHTTAAAFPNGGSFIWYTGSDSVNHMTLASVGRVDVTITPFPVADAKK
jgi:hypothetical protein